MATSISDLSASNRRLDSAPSLSETNPSSRRTATAPTLSETNPSSRMAATAPKLSETNSSGRRSATAPSLGESSSSNRVSETMSSGYSGASNHASNLSNVIGSIATNAASFRVAPQPMSSSQQVLGKLIGGNVLNRIPTRQSQPYKSMDPLQGALARSDPLLSYNWFCQLPILNHAGGATLEWNYVEAASLPLRTIQTNSVYKDGKQHNYASMFSTDNLSLTFYLDESAKAFSYLASWDSLISPYTGRQNLVSTGAEYNLPAVYMKDITLYILNNKREEVIAITYVGCFPINFGSLGLTSNSSDRLTQDVQFNVNNIVIDVVGVEGNSFNQLSHNVNNNVLQGMNIVSPRLPRF